MKTTNYHAVDNNGNTFTFAKSKSELIQRVNQSRQKHIFFNFEKTKINAWKKAQRKDDSFVDPVILTIEKRTTSLINDNDLL